MEIYISDLWLGLIGGCSISTVFWFGLILVVGIARGKKRVGSEGGK